MAHIQCFARDPHSRGSRTRNYLLPSHQHGNYLLPSHQYSNYLLLTHQYSNYLL